MTETIRRLYHGTQRRHRGNNGLNATSSRLVTRNKVNFSNPNVCMMYVTAFISPLPLHMC